jgi:hypothetical protein
LGVGGHQSSVGGPQSKGNGYGHDDRDSDDRPTSWRRFELNVCAARRAIDGDRHTPDQLLAGERRGRCVTGVRVPGRPSGGDALTAWQNAMDVYAPETAPPTTITVPSTPQDASTFASNWAGFTAGESGTQSHAFVAVQGDVTVPTVNGCFGSNQVVFAWIGLGGTNGPNDLVQQGVECNDYGTGSNLPDSGGLHPFREFADTNYPQNLCGTSQTLSGGETMYENMGYESSIATANFFMENAVNGNIIGQCSVSAPKNWTFDGNTADYEVEVDGPQEPLQFNVSKVSFSDAQLEFGSNGDWVAFGSRPTTKTYDGVSLSNYCEGPSTIGSDNESFSVTQSSGDCP